MTEANSGEFVVERRTTIGAPPAAVYALIEDFHRWTDWSPWEGIDPKLDRAYTGAESGVGAVYEWGGNRKAGAGVMKITAADPPREIVIALTFHRPFKSSSTVRFTLAPTASGTEVVWSMTGRKTLMTRVMGVFMSMDKMVGPDFEKGLAQLAAAAEG